MSDQKFEYKVGVYRENLLGSLFLMASKVDPIRFTDFLNRNGLEGWEVATMEREIRRMLLFFKREAFIVIFKKVIDEPHNIQVGEKDQDA